MTVHGAGKVQNKSAGPPAESFEEVFRTAKFAENFIDCFLRAIPHLARNKVKLAVNVGASDTEILAKVIRCSKTCAEAGYPLNVAWVEGDDVTEQVNELIAKGEEFESLMHGRKLEEWGFDPICAQACLGGLGIAEAPRQGADVVICRRVADAALAIGAAA
jgi:hypothetical protein